MKPMKLRASLLVLGLVVAGVSCGSDTEESVDSVAPETTYVESTDTASTVESTTPVVSTTIEDGIVRISVTVGVDSGPDRIEEVSVGDSVELTMVNPDEDDEFHVHGFDLGGDETPAGDEKVFAFTADEPGDFEVESHATGDVLVVIRVS
jgi:hypothetical protein